jgi:SAM-dependent methyltransferase
MKVTPFLEAPVGSLLDVGCNVGAWLGNCAHMYPTARLAGVEINETSLALAREKVPSAEFHHAGGEKLPFPSESFDYVTCFEVLEHMPLDLRSTAFREMNRVLRTGGRLLLTVPHAGWFAWLDSNNFRFRLPGLYRFLIGRGGRDANYASAGRKVEWHYHFTVAELMQLAGGSWRTVAVRHGGLFICPLMDWFSWPFYRAGRADHPMRRMMERIACWDYDISYGSASFGVLIVLERLASESPANPPQQAAAPIAAQPERA